MAATFNVTYIDPYPICSYTYSSSGLIIYSNNKEVKQETAQQLRDRLSKEKSIKNIKTKKTTAKINLPNGMLPKFIITNKFYLAQINR